jgi:aerobic carbon-monoxide dehydrogenase medium subunit
MHLDHPELRHNTTPMIPASFDYVRAASVAEALALLVEHDPDSKVIAGGQSLLPLMKLRLARPERLIDIGRLEELRGVQAAAGGGLAIGALTTYAELLDDVIVGRFGLFADALPRIGDVQVRNRGTIGGSIAHADPAADLPAVLLALDGVVVARSAARGERPIDIAAFFEGAFATALAEDELVTEIRLPAPSGSVGSAYQALEQQASGYPIAGVAAVVGDVIRVAVTGVGDHPYRATEVEAALVAGAPVHEAVESITNGVDVNGDIHADPEYRAAMARVMAKRAIELARARLG